MFKQKCLFLLNCLYTEDIRGEKVFLQTPLPQEEKDKLDDEEIVGNDGESELEEFKQQILEELKKSDQTILDFRFKVLQMLTILGTFVAVSLFVISYYQKTKESAQDYLVKLLEVVEKTCENATTAINKAKAALENLLEDQLETQQMLKKNSTVVIDQLGTTK